MVSAERVLEAARRYGVRPEHCKVDDIGVGGGLTDRLWHRGYQCERVNVGRQASKPGLYANQRAEAAWQLRMALREWLALPSDESGRPTIKRLLAELTAPRLRDPTPSGAMRLEPKEETSKRLGRSPDCFDALMLALYYPPRERTAQYGWDARAEFYPEGIVPGLD
jgi:hypothetical protein